MKYPRLFLIALLFPCLVFSQREIMQADAAFEANRFFNSGQLYRKALTKKKTETDKGRIFFQIGECERLLVNPTAAQVYYSKAIGAAYPDCIVHFRLAQMQQMNGQYMAAIQSYDIYKNCAPSDPRAQEGIDACNLAVQWLSETTRWVITNEGQLNSNENDFCPTWSDRNHRSLVFSSKRAGQSGAKIDPNSGTLYSDLFEARINTNGKWSSPQAVQGGVNTPVSNDGASCITKNGSHIFFTRCDQQKKKVVTCKIYYAVKQGNGWGTPALIDFGLDAATLDSFNFRHPAVSLNEEVMVFSSDMPGSLGGVHSDLWISTYDRQTKSWGKPVNMGGAINTKGREGFPSIDESGDLYFSSDGHHGFGGLDIYKAPRLTTNQSGTWSWSKPVNMKVPFNSPADDFGIIFDGKKKKGYLTSNREGTKGRDDIWRFHLPPCNPVVSGKVIDTTAHVAVQNALVIIDYADNTQETKRTDAKGDFAFIVAEDETFVLSFRADSLTKSSAGVFYFTPPSAAFQNGKFTTVGLETCVDYKHNFVIGGVTRETDIAFPAVLYELDSSRLLPESKDSLNYLYHLLMENPNLVIEIGSHTDCRGSTEYNRTLSQARALSCINYLVKEKGIAPERLVARGYGEDSPLKLSGEIVLTEKYINTMPEKEKESLHRLNRRTVFKVLRQDYVDPSAPKTPVKQVKVRKGYFDESGVAEPEELKDGDRP